MLKQIFGVAKANAGKIAVGIGSLAVAGLAVWALSPKTEESGEAEATVEVVEAEEPASEV